VGRRRGDEVFAVHDDGEVCTVLGRQGLASLGVARRRIHRQPAAAARDADRIDVFAIGIDGALRHRWWNGTRWVEWQDVAGAPRAGRAVACAWSGAASTSFSGAPTAACITRTSHDERFDFVIIGAGASGEAAASYARARGATVALVERDLFGGTCAFWVACRRRRSCTPRRFAHAAVTIRGESVRAPRLHDRARGPRLSR